MGLISWIAVGLVTGLLARRTRFGTAPGGLIFTNVVGMAGASIGGLLAMLIEGAGASGFKAWSIPVAALGAVVLLLLYYLVVREDGAHSDL